VLRADFSAEGLFIMTDDPRAPVGTDIHFEVDLETPSLGSAVTVRAKGKVNRYHGIDRPSWRICDFYAKNEARKAKAPLPGTACGRVLKLRQAGPTFRARLA
jgi:hypothetical protein